MQPRKSGQPHKGWKKSAKATAEVIKTVDISRRAWLEKELADNPDHPTNMYLTKDRD